jgi:transcriptional regulator with XRE-family HTH domain
VRKSIHSEEARIFQELLRKARTEAGLTQEQLAELLGIGQAVVSNYERGERRLDLVELTQVLDAIGLPLHTFIARYEHATGRVLAGTPGSEMGDVAQ